jgi:hypothetical protein
MYSQDILDLAQSMGVSPADVLMFAQSVANSMQQDKMQDSKDVETVLAYAQHSVRKYRDFSNRYFSNPNAAKAFQMSVFGA